MNLLVACGGEGVSTPWAYGVLDGAFGNFAARRTPDTRKLRASAERGDIGGICRSFTNIFRGAILRERPSSGKSRLFMLQNGAN
jgi:hypothetical protein